jgi:hypothetical protein
MLEAGAPFVALGLIGDDPQNGFDLHGAEETKAPPLFAHSAQIIAGIHFVLTNMGLLDSTVVVVVSEFNRTCYPGGYNGGRGSDHGQGPYYGSTPSWRYQPVVMFGGGIKPKLVNPTDPDTNNPITDSCSATRILYTLAKLAGVPDEAIPYSTNPDTFFDGPDGLWSLWT